MYRHDAVLGRMASSRTVMFGSQTAHSAISLHPIGASVVRTKKSEETTMARRNATIPAIVAAIFFLDATAMLPYPKAEAKSQMPKQVFGKIQDGQSVDLYTLTNKYGMTAAISTQTSDAGISSFQPNAMNWS